MEFHQLLTQFGKLEIFETYEFYDRPLLFSCINNVGNLFLAVIIEENDEDESWLYVSISKTRLKQVRSGKIDLHDAFTRAENGNVFKIKIFNNQFVQPIIESISVELLTDDVLPIKGELLGINTQTLPSAEMNQDLVIRARQSQREQITLRLTLSDEKMTEAPSYLLGEILIRFQELINSVSISLRESTNLRSLFNISPQMNVRGFAHSSFAVELISRSIVDLFGESEVGRALERVLSLIEIGDDHNNLREMIISLRPRVALNYAMFLKTIEGKVNSISIDWASPKNQFLRTTIISSTKAKDTITVIEKTELQQPRLIRTIGTLIGANLRSKIFEISAIDDTKRKKYSGKIHDNSLNSIKGSILGRDYQIKLEETLVINLATGQVEHKYSLLDLHEL